MGTRGGPKKCGWTYGVWGTYGDLGGGEGNLQVLGGTFGVWGTWGGIYGVWGSYGALVGLRGTQECWGGNPGMPGQRLRRGRALPTPRALPPPPCNYPPPAAINTCGDRRGGSGPQGHRVGGGGTPQHRPPGPARPPLHAPHRRPSIRPSLICPSVPPRHVAPIALRCRIHIKAVAFVGWGGFGDLIPPHPVDLCQRSPPPPKPISPGCPLDLPCDPPPSLGPLSAPTWTLMTPWVPPRCQRLPWGSSDPPSPSPRVKTDPHLLA